MSHHAQSGPARRNLILEELEARVMLSGAPLADWDPPDEADDPGAPPPSEGSESEPLNTAVAADRFENNDDPSEATYLGPVGDYYTAAVETGLTMDDTDVDAGEPVDLFLVYLDGDRLEANIYFSNAQGDLDLYLWDIDLNEIAGAETGTDNEHIDESGLDPGYYYVEVYGYGGTNPDYDLEIIGYGSVDFVADDRFEDNDTTGQAVALGTVGAGYSTIRENTLTMDHTDAENGTPQDYYKVVLDGDELEVNLLFDDSDGNLDLYVFDSSGANVGVGETTTDNEHVLATNLDSGTYYVEVFGYSGTNPDYDLEIIGRGVGDVGPDSLEDNDRPADATFLGPVGDDYTTITKADLTMDSDDVDANDPQDYYLVYLDGNAIDVSITFDDDLGNLDLYLLDLERTELGSSESGSDNESVVVAGLDSGYYYVLVEGEAQPDYDLEITGTGSTPDVAPDAFEQNDAMGTASDLGTVGDLHDPIAETGLTMDHDDAEAGAPFDYYEVTLDGDTLDIDLTFAHADGDLDLSLYDADGDLIAESVSHTDNESLSVTGLASGPYTIEVFGYGGTNPDYDLGITGSGAMTVTDATGPLSFGDSDGDILTLTVNGDGRMLVTVTDFAGLGWDIESIVARGGDGDTEFLVESAGPGDGAQVASLEVRSPFETVLVEGDMDDLTILNAIASTVEIQGTLGQGSVGGDVWGDLLIGALDGDLFIGDDIEAPGLVQIGAWLSGEVELADHLKGALTFLGDAGDVTFGRDIIGALTIAGAGTGTVTVGDDIEEEATVAVGGSLVALDVADDIKSDNVTIGADLDLLTVGETVWRVAEVTVANDLDTADIGQNLNGRLTAEHLTGALTTAENLGGTFRLTSADPCSADISLGGDLVGTLDLPGDHTGAIHIGDDIEFGARVLFGGSVNELDVADHIKTGFDAPDGLGWLEVGRDVYAGAVIDVTGALGGADIGRDLLGSLTVDTLAGPVTIGDDLRGDSLTVTDSAEITVDITLGGDLAGRLDLGGNYTGILTIGDDIEGSADLRLRGAANSFDLVVADHIKTGFDVAGDLLSLEVGRDIRPAAVVTVSGSLGPTDIGRDLLGSLTTNTLAGPVTIGDDLAGNSLTVTDTAEITVDITLGGDLAGTLDLGGNYTGTLTIGDDIEFSADLLLRGAANSFDLVVADHIKTGFDVVGDLLSLEVGRDIRPAAIVTVSGSIGTTDIGRDLLGFLNIGGNADGIIAIGDDIEEEGAVFIGGACFRLDVADDIKSDDVVITGDCTRLDVGETIWRVAEVSIGGTLDVADMGQKLNGVLTAEALSGSLTTGHDLEGTFALTTADPCVADITIGRHLEGTLDVAGLDTGARLTVGQDVRSDLVLGEVLGDIRIHDDLRGSLTLDGDLTGSLEIDDESTGPIDINGDVYGDIVIGDMLVYLESFSDPVPTGTEPIDYYFHVLGTPEGALRVGTTIGTILQA